jgi:asparagine synthase (glutamine-hydrolysing)
MCGIAGIISHQPFDKMLSTLKKMSDAIAHRGPDGQGQWANSPKTVGLAHRRLAILDIGQRGAQPMHYKNRYSISFNGEIYNYIELKKDLEKKGYQFQNNTDTEVLLALYDAFGSDCLHRLDGMFAFAIYDEEKQRVFCARDRFGEKPFYYYHKEGVFYFGSEMKALWAGGVPKMENQTMQYNYLAYGFMNNPENIAETFYQDIYELPHSQYLEYDIRSSSFDIKSYFSIAQESSELSTVEAQEKLQTILKTSVLKRLRSDVTVGTSLSGGIDSSIIASLVKENSGDQVLKTFSAIFPDYVRDESFYIGKTAEKLNVSSFTCTPSLKEFQQDKLKFLEHQEEPVVDESPYILYKVYELARKNNIKVLLDGQGADEIFAGYHAYFFVYLKELRQRNRILYRDEMKMFKTLANKGLINDYRFFRRQNLLSILFGEKLSDIRIWKQKLDQFKANSLDKTLKRAQHGNSFRRKYVFQSLDENLKYDALKGKLQTLLRYADRSSMAHGVEVRLPYLSHELVNFVFSLSSELKIKEGWTKWILRETFKDYLADEVVWRRDKVGAEGELK